MQGTKPLARSVCDTKSGYDFSRKAWQEVSFQGDNPLRGWKGWPVAGVQKAVNRTCRFATRAHGENHGCRATDNITASKDASFRGTQGRFVGQDVAPAIGFQVRRGGLDQRVGTGADGDDRDIDGKQVVRIGAGDRAATAGFIGWSQFHALEANSRQLARRIADKFNRILQRKKLEPLVLGDLHFFLDVSHHC